MIKTLIEELNETIENGYVYINDKKSLIKISKRNQKLNQILDFLENYEVNKNIENDLVIEDIINNVLNFIIKKDNVKTKSEKDDIDIKKQPQATKSLYYWLGCLI